MIYDFKVYVDGSVYTDVYCVYKDGSVNLESIGIVNDAKMTQFTGILDMHRNKIYDLDLVRVHNEIHTVRYVMGQYRLENPRSDSKYLNLGLFGRKGIIVGNVLEKSSHKSYNNR